MNTTSGQKDLTLTTLLLALASEATLFTTLVMSYLFLRTQNSGTPFIHLGTGDRLIASLNTLVLLASAGLAWGALRAIAAGQDRQLSAYLLGTLALGAVFITGQVFEFAHSGLHIDDTIFGGMFFTLLGFHALHVLAGMTILGLNAARARLGDFSIQRHTAITVGTWFWYFVVAVWVVLYGILYLV